MATNTWTMTLAMVGFFAATPVALANLAARSDSALEAALGFFTQHDAADIVTRLDAARPTPAAPEERRLVLATLPTDGEIFNLNALQREKLAAAQRIFELLGRDTVYVVKVIKVPRAALALHGRTVVLITKAALDLLDAAELQALVAHEAGHEYFWEEYFRARRHADLTRLRTLELLCDGFALVTLRRAGADPTRLTTALEKVIRYNNDHFGPAVNEGHYPAIEQRRDFARRLTEWLGPPAWTSRGAPFTSMQESRAIIPPR